ncbi:MAG TPA: bifunctional YncE family protein/alkaline phosphatase family protein [Gemmatimonadaceae bacterium]|nr:bifunctional YncE family protein/alkaline phosphatase family protein [Gemmatimonadaceae bacterium]
MRLAPLHIGRAPIVAMLGIVSVVVSHGLRGQTPRGNVRDPGVIATDQRVTPAGVQTVFDDRVTGVRFAAPSDLWVVVPGSAFHIAWADNRVIARGRFDGRSGVQGVAIDPTTGRALVSSVGGQPTQNAQSPMPGLRTPPRPNNVAVLNAFDRDAAGDSATPAYSSGALGDYMAGSPAVATRAGADGRRVAVVPLTANDALAVIEAETGRAVRLVPLGVAPVAVVLSPDGAVAYVSNLGGTQPKPGERSATQCCDPRAERVKTDTRGIAAEGTVTRVDVSAGRVTHTLRVGRHPTALAWDEPNARLYVAGGNADAVSVIDTRSNAVIATLPVAPFRERNIGLAPTALALSPDRGTLYVALGGANAVAVYDVHGVQSPTPAWRLLGLIPTAWYPSSLDVSSDGEYLAVGALLGVGSGEGATEGSPGRRARYVHAVRGSVSVVTIPTATELAAYSTAVAENNRLTPAAAGGAVAASLAPRPNAVPQPIPERPGEPTPIRHVVFIIRENRTYDQILGDLGRGAGDSSLVIYGRDVTPNTHALSERFVTLDHFFASGGNSADGHQWITQANETEYPLWPLYHGRSYPSEGNDPLAYSSGGFLWENAQAKGKRVAVFGEYAPAPSDSISAVRRELFAQWHTPRADRPAYFRDALRKRYDTRSQIPSLDKALIREYPGWTQEVPDVVKAEDILAHLRDWNSAGSMPELTMVILPSDHTVGTTPGWCTPRACVADNDLALGMIVEGLSHSRFWPTMAIFVVEDDAQNGVDHIDGHRTVALAISPYTRRGIVDSTFYSQPSMVKTIELILGLPAMSLFDLVATDMRASFIGPGQEPDLAPYTAIEPGVSLTETNARVGEIHGPNAAERRRAALASARMRFDIPDAAPSDRLNRILWHEARGWQTPFPGVKQALFFPMSRDLADDEREEKGERAPRKPR